MDNLLQVLQPNSPLFYLLIAWALIWKGVALWHAARNRQLAWYIAILVVNTVGLLEIVYLAYFRKKGPDASSSR